jgi:hypothetical protein
VGLGWGASGTEVITEKVYVCYMTLLIYKCKVDFEFGVGGARWGAGRARVGRRGIGWGASGTESLKYLQNNCVYAI